MTKRVDIAYVCWLFGLHYLYLGRPAMWLLFVASLFVGIGLLWWIIDAFRLPRLIEDHNLLVEARKAKDNE